MAIRDQLFEVWAARQHPLLGAEHGRFVKAFARWFLKPEADRAAHEPSDAEVPAALESILLVNESGGPGAKYGTPELASERIGHIVKVRRQYADDPGMRLEVIARRLGIRMAPPAEFVGR